MDGHEGAMNCEADGGQVEVVEENRETVVHTSTFNRKHL